MISTLLVIAILTTKGLAIIGVASLIGIAIIEN